MFLAPFVGYSAKPHIYDSAGRADGSNSRRVAGEYSAEDRRFDPLTST